MKPQATRSLKKKISAVDSADPVVARKQRVAVLHERISAGKSAEYALPVIETYVNELEEKTFQYFVNNVDNDVDNFNTEFKLKSMKLRVAKEILSAFTTKVSVGKMAETELSKIKE